MEEAAVALRIGRTAAYQLARRWLDTDGADGLPVIRIGRQLRVPVASFEQLLGQQLTAATDAPPSASTATAPPASPRRTRRSTTHPGAQSSLPFPD